MSENQFAQLISSLNTGGGTPCTIEYDWKRGRINAPEFRDEVTEIRKDVEKKATDATGDLTKALAFLEHLSDGTAALNKTNVRAAMEAVRTATRQLQANLPYLLECFHENIDDAVTSAKADIEAYVSDAAARAGLSRPSIQEPTLATDVDVTVPHVSGKGIKRLNP